MATYSSFADAITVEPVAGRPAILALADEAKAALRSTLSSLAPHEQAALANAPLDWSLGLVRDESRHLGFLGARAALASIAARLQAADPAVATIYARLLLLTAISRLPQAAPLIRIPRFAWPTIESAFATILANALQSPLGLGEEFYEKDLAAAQLAVVPVNGSVATFDRFKPAVLARHAPRRERLRLLAYLGRAYFHRRTYIGNHQWRGFREAINGPWQNRAALNATLLAANPSLAGLTYDGWLVDPALASISPHLRARFDGYQSVGGRLFRIPIDALSHERALASSSTRRELYDAGKYTPRSYVLLAARRDYLRWLKTSGAWSGR